MNTNIDQSVIESLAKILKEIGSVRDCRGGPDDEDEDVAWARLTDEGRRLRSLLKLNTEARWQDLGDEVEKLTRKKIEFPEGWWLHSILTCIDSTKWYRAHGPALRHVSLAIFPDGRTQWAGNLNAPLAVYTALINQAGVTNEL